MLSSKSVEKQISAITYKNQFSAVLPLEGCDRDFRFLNKVLSVLKTKPDELYLKSEITRLKNRKETILSSFDTWKQNNVMEWRDKFDFTGTPEQCTKQGIQLFTYYKSQMGLTVVNRQLKALQFIINPKSTVIKNEVANV